MAVYNKPLCRQIVLKINNEDFLLHPIIFPKIKRNDLKKFVLRIIVTLIKIVISNTLCTTLCTDCFKNK